MIGRFAVDRVYVASLLRWKGRLVGDLVTHGVVDEAATSNGRKVVGMLCDFAQATDRPGPVSRVLKAVQNRPVMTWTRADHAVIGNW